MAALNVQKLLYLGFRDTKRHKLCVPLTTFTHFDQQMFYFPLIFAYLSIAVYVMIQMLLHGMGTISI